MIENWTNSTILNIKCNICSMSVDAKGLKISTNRPGCGKPLSEISKRVKFPSRDKLQDERCRKRVLRGSVPWWTFTAGTTPTALCAASGR